MANNIGNVNSGNGCGCCFLKGCLLFIIGIAVISVIFFFAVKSTATKELKNVIISSAEQYSTYTLKDPVLIKKITDSADSFDTIIDNGEVSAFKLFTKVLNAFNAEFDLNCALVGMYAKSEDYANASSASADSVPASASASAPAELASGTVKSVVPEKPYLNEVYTSKVKDIIYNLSEKNMSVKDLATFSMYIQAEYSSYSLSSKKDSFVSFGGFSVLRRSGEDMQNILDKTVFAYTDKMDLKKAPEDFNVEEYACEVMLERLNFLKNNSEKQEGDKNSEAAEPTEKTETPAAK